MQQFFSLYILYINITIDCKGNVCICAMTSHSKPIRCTNNCLVSKLTVHIKASSHYHLLHIHEIRNELHTYRSSEPFCWKTNTEDNIGSWMTYRSAVSYEMLCVSWSLSSKGLCALFFFLFLFVSVLLCLCNDFKPNRLFILLFSNNVAMSLSVAQ